MRSSALRVIAVLLLPAVCPAAERLTLQDAELLALKNHPQLQAARFLEQAAGQVTAEVKSRLYPTVYGSATGAVAENDNTRIMAGALNNPIIYNRLGAGVTVSQLISDFGRTRRLTESAQARAQAQGEAVTATRAQVLMQVDRAYFAILRAQAVLQVAKETVKARQVVADQAAVLAANKLRSDLDVSFARVNLDEAKLLLSNAQNDEKSSRAELAAAMGLGEARDFEVVEVQLPDPLPQQETPLVEQALQNRPEIVQARLEEQSARKFVQAERALKFPTISGIGTAGYAPLHIERLQSSWAAAGINVDIPVFNGGLFSARRAEAEARSLAAEQVARDLSNRIARDVRLAYLDAVNAFERLTLTAQLLEQASMSFKLAQARYDLGLSSIVELSQAQLNVTRAQIAQASARFEYQSQRAFLDYQRGLIR
jgi:outer membrane protein